MSLEQAGEALKRAVRFHQEGRIDEAEALYREVLRVVPDQPAVLNNLGLLASHRGQEERAVRCFRRAIAIQPDHAGALTNLGVVLERRGELKEAEACHRRAVRVEPNNAVALNNLGNVLAAQGRSGEAIEVYLEALSVAPPNPRTLGNLATSYHEAGAFDKAEQTWRMGLNQWPSDASLLHGLAHTLHRLDRFEEATRFYEEASARDPSWSLPPANLGSCFLEQDRLSDARDAFKRALALEQCPPFAVIQEALALPILYPDTASIKVHRARFEEGLSRLEARLEADATWREAAAPAFARHSNFYLQYQGCDDKALQRRYALLMSRSVETVVPKWEPPTPLDPEKKRLRVGFLSQFFYEHTVGRLLEGFIRGLDPERFDVELFHMGSRRDALTRRLISGGIRIHSLSPRFPDIVRHVREARLDILLFSDVGMTPMAGALAALRCAPVQGVFWGHPITSGIPAMDFFLSSAAMEPEGAQEHYSERLVLLGGPGLAYARPPIPGDGWTRSEFLARFGLDDGKPIVLSLQSLYKYHPAFDCLYPAIAKKLDGVQMVFLAHPRSREVQRHFEARMERAFHAEQLDARNFLSILPHLSRDDYLRLNACGDVFLDTPMWSGGNTTLEALAAGLPVVTMPGEFLRARHAMGFLNTVGLNELVVSTVEDYVNLVVRLIEDPSYNEGIRARIRDRADVLLFGREDCVRELEAAFFSLWRMKAAHWTACKGRPVDVENGMAGERSAAR